MAKTATKTARKTTVSKGRDKNFTAWLNDGTYMTVKGTHPMDAYDRLPVADKMRVREVVDYIGE